jgi:hypothetical protein
LPKGGVRLSSGKKLAGVEDSGSIRRERMAGRNQVQSAPGRRPPGGKNPSDAARGIEKKYFRNQKLGEKA